MPSTQQQAKCWQGQCTRLAAHGISRELRDLAERRACAGDQERPPHPCSGSRPAQSPPEQSQDAKSLSARPSSNARQAAGQAWNRAGRQQRGRAGAGPEQPHCAPGPQPASCCPGPAPDPWQSHRREVTRAPLPPPVPHHCCVRAGAGQLPAACPPCRHAGNVEQADAICPPQQ